MAIPTRGSRPLRVDDIDYRWTIRPRPTYVQGIAQGTMHLAVQQVGEEPRTVLVVDLQVRRPDNWIRRTGTGITPAVVEDVVRAARLAGWVPDRAGATHRFEYGVICEAVGLTHRRVPRG